MISPNQILLDSGFGGVSGGGSSTSSDRGSGTWALDGLWIDLRFDDGRQRRVTVFAADPSDNGARMITVGGQDLFEKGP
jgi:hypothetical protein